MTAEKPNEKLPSSTDPAENNFVSFDADSCIDSIKRPEKKYARKTSQQLQQIAKKVN